MIEIWKLVQEELHRVDYQGLLTEVQIAKRELEDMLRHEEGENSTRTGTKVTKEEGKDKTSGHSEVRRDRTKIKQNEGAMDPNAEPTTQEKGKEPRRHFETDRQTSRQQAGQQ